MERQERATVAVRVTTSAVKIHGPNSTLAAEGTREKIEMTDPGPHMVEITYSEAVNMFGPEKAEELFAGVPEEDR